MAVPSWKVVVCRGRRRLRQRYWFRIVSLRNWRVLAHSENYRDRAECEASAHAIADPAGAVVQDEVLDV